MTKGIDDIKRKAGIKLFSEVNEDELAVRIIESMGQCRRVQDVYPTEALNTMTPPEVAASARATARTAILYIAECFGASVQAQ